MHICLIEADDGMREALTSILEDAGYAVNHCWPPQRALEYLHAAQDPLIAIISNQTPDNHALLAFFEQVASDRALASRHRYLALTTAVANFTPRERELLAGLRAPIIEKPFNLETLLAALAD